MELEGWGQGISLGKWTSSLARSYGILEVFGVAILTSCEGPASISSGSDLARDWRETILRIEHKK